ncbi:hypothetical protein [Paenibacillus camelliae]|uniref:hypothetical protein n=1 Tax=Paenibacillus camelliae TaxID=512410 RepID=UPI00203EA2AA|nr:hypothetical protein [Paenibacillus camelliae]MCM3631891.1 hypothetical protein [Paenibacillus camelliae]
MRKNRYLTLAVGCALMLIFGCDNTDQQKVVQIPSNPVIQDGGQETSSIAVGSIESKDGKNLKISMSGRTENNFGEMSFRKGETFKISVKSENEGELEIGVMSITTEQVYSDTVKSGEGEFIIKIPEEGKYRIYISNKDEQSANFHMKLSKAIEGPLV